MQHAVQLIRKIFRLSLKKEDYQYLIKTLSCFSVMSHMPVALLRYLFPMIKNTLKDFLNIEFNFESSFDKLIKVIINKFL